MDQPGQPAIRWRTQQTQVETTDLSELRRPVSRNPATITFEPAGYPCEWVVKKLLQNPAKGGVNYTVTLEFKRSQPAAWDTAFVDIEIGQQPKNDANPSRWLIETQDLKRIYCENGGIHASTALIDVAPGELVP